MTLLSCSSPTSEENATGDGISEQESIEEKIFEVFTDDEKQLLDDFDFDDFNDKNSQNRINQSLRKIAQAAGLPNIRINYIPDYDSDDFGKTIMPSCEKKEMLFDSDNINEWANNSNSNIPFLIVASHEFAHYIYEHKIKDSPAGQDEFEADYFTGKILRSLNYGFKEIEMVLDKMNVFYLSQMVIPHGAIENKKNHIELGWLVKNIEVINLNGQEPTKSQKQRLADLKQNINIQIPDSIYFNESYPIAESKIDITSSEKTLKNVLPNNDMIFDFSISYINGFYFNKNYDNFWRDGNFLVKPSDSTIDTIGTIKPVKDKNLKGKYVEKIIIGDKVLFIDKNQFIIDQSTDSNSIIIGLTFNKIHYLNLIKQ